jgi:twitching motility protein PilT
MNFTLAQLLEILVIRGASDLHISSDSPPRLRISGNLVPLDFPPLTPDQTKQLCYSVLTEQQQKNFETDKEIDLAFSVKGAARFRANIYLQKGCVSGAFRLIPFKIKPLPELGLPAVLYKLCDFPRGLILVTGPTGSGKSTTLAAMIDYINEKRQEHIVTIEDPVEFIHTHKKCMINQRELNADTNSFGRALRSVLRQDPDVVLVGELRDLDTISLAITTAETGHLVFGTLHTNSCISSINRLIDVFPAHQQPQIRTQLSFTLVGVLSQLLIQKNGGGRVVSIELMIPNVAIRTAIREDKLHLIYSMIQTGQGISGMITMNQSLAKLVQKKVISRDEARSKSPDIPELEAMLGKNGINGK